MNLVTYMGTCVDTDTNFQLHILTIGVIIYLA